MKKKRILALFLAAAMILAATGCGSTENKEESKSENKPSSESSSKSTEQSEPEEELYYNVEGYPICDEPITLSIMLPDYTNVLVEDTKRVQTDWYAEKLGIELEVIPYTTESYATQLSLRLAEDNLPDLVSQSGFNKSVITEYGEQGYLLDLSQYLHLMPNLQAVFEENPDYKSFVSTESGAIYGLFPFAPGLTFARCYFNHSYMENLDLEIPRTVDELYDVLKAFKEEDANGNGDPNDEIPMQYTMNTSYVDTYLFNAFGMNPQNTNVPVDLDESGKVRLTFMTENYKAYLQFMHKLYSEELIDQECYSTTEDIVKQKYKEELIGFGGELAPYITRGTQDEPYGVVQIAYPMTSDYNDEAFISESAQATDTCKFFVSANCQYPEAVARFIDFMFTFEGAMSQYYGVEGITYELKDIEGTAFREMSYLKDGEYAEMSNDEFKTKVCVANCAIDFSSIALVPGSNLSQGIGVYIDYVKKYQAGEIDDATYEELRLKYGWGFQRAEMEVASGAETRGVYPTLAYTSEDAKKRTEVLNAITTYLADAKAQFIIGGLDFETDWDSYIAELNKMGAQELLAIEQAAYDRMY